MKSLDGVALVPRRELPTFSSLPTLDPLGVGNTYSVQVLRLFLSSRHGSLGGATCLKLVHIYI